MTLVANPALADANTAPANTAPSSLIDDPAEWSAFTRWPTTAAGRRIAESSLRIGGMHCAACAGLIEQALSKLPGVVDAQVSAAAHCATVRWDAGLTRPSALLRAIEAAGYQAAPDTAVAARALRRREARVGLWRLFVATLCAMQIMMFAAPAYFSAAGDLATEHKRLLDWASWLLALPVMAFSAWPFFAGAWASLRHRRIAMDVPVALGIGVAFIASTGAALAPGGPFGDEVWFDSLAMFVSFLLAGRYLEMRARHRAEQALEDSLGQLPQSALRVADDGRVEAVSASQLRAGDRVRVPLGQAFAADGVLLEGSTQVDEALLTGESRPVDKARGDALIAGSLNLGAPVEMRVEHVGADTRFEAIVALMRSARSQRPAIVAAADRWAAPFLWTVLLLAAAAGVVWSIIEPARAVWVVVSVLIVTCPCALSLAAPSAMLAAAGAMGRRGVLLRRLDAIQGLARMHTLFVDKTGTLTEGQLRCVAVQRLAAPGGATDAQWQQVAASLAAWSSHPLAQALHRSGAAAAMSWQQVREQAGQGLEGVDADGRLWRLGGAHWSGVKSAGPQVHGVCGQAVPSDADGRQAQTWLACDGHPLLRFGFDERLRDDAQAAVRALADDGVAVQLLSGDAPARSRRIAAELGITAGVRAMSPADKLATVVAAQHGGAVVAMLGDGINDAPVLARADVSIAMGEGALLARSQADAVLVSNRLGDLVFARQLSRRTMRVLRQNFAWAGVYNLACVPLALVGLMPPWAAGLGMAASSLFVVLNSLRLAR
jgi:Cu2+-exporting ATPase